MAEQKKKVYVSKASEQRSPEALRKVSRAIIALARAQLEAEAEAAHAVAKDAPAKPRKSA